MKRVKRKCPLCSTALAPIPIRDCNEDVANRSSLVYRTCRKCHTQFYLTVVERDEGGYYTRWGFMSEENE